MRDDVLFWKLDWFQVVEHQKYAARRDAEAMSKADFQGASIEELAQRLCEKYSLVPPTIDPENIVVKSREIQIDVSNDRSRYFSTGGQHFVKGTAVDASLPFAGDAGMFDIKPTTFNYNPPRARVRNGRITFTVSGTNLTSEKVEAEIDGMVKDIQEWLVFQQKSVGNYPAELAQTVRQALEARKKKLDADTELLSGLKYKRG